MNGICDSNPLFALAGMGSARKEMPVRAVKVLRKTGSGKCISLLAGCTFAVCFVIQVSGMVRADDGVVTPQITIDQFGWLPQAHKVAILADPVKGQNAGQSYRPGKSFEIRREADGMVAFRGATNPWNSGAVSELAGDRVWFADFSGLRAPGAYDVFDPTNSVRSFPFRISDDVYKPVLRDAVRVFYYQRSGTPITEKNGGVWHHPGGHLGKDQDRAAQYTQGGKTQGRPRDVLGGWFDAGDLNKYVPYLETTLFDLLWAYELNPRAFGDDTNIPESGNGVPDLLDEVKWELDWLLKMQDADGGFFNRVAGRSFDNGTGPPSGDTQPRFYTAKTTWATADAAASLAHAARVYSRFEKAFPGYAERLRQAARHAWEYLDAHAEMDPSDGTDGDSKLAATAAGSNASGDRRARVYAAAELFKTVAAPAFKSYVDRWALDIAATADNGQHPFKDWKQVDPLNHPALTQGLFIYATTKGASSAVSEPFKEALSHTAESIRQASGGPDDPYLAYPLRGALLLGEQFGQRAMGARAADGHRAGTQSRASLRLSRSHDRISQFYSRTESALALLLEQHDPRRSGPLCDRGLSPVVSRRLAAL